MFLKIFQKIRKDSRGSALILAMIVLISGVLIFSAISSISLLQRSASSKARSSTEAFQLADSCVEWSLWKYKNHSGDPISTIGSFNGDVFSLDNLPSSLTVGGEEYDTGCDMYLIGADRDGDGKGDVINDATELLSTVEEVRSIATAGSGEDVARRAVQVGLTASCPATFTDDRDGQEYKAVKIGDQCWMAENLNVGEPIPLSQRLPNKDAIIEKWCYNNDCDSYGGLYTLAESLDGDSIPGSKGICPEGWHIPKIDEYYILMEKQGYTGHLSGGCDSSTDSKTAENSLEIGGESPFEAGFYGSRHYFYGTASFTDFGDKAKFLTFDGSIFSIVNGEGLCVQTYPVTEGLSVRCLKD